MIRVHPRRVDKRPGAYKNVFEMNRICALALTTWVFVAYPLLCMSGLTTHACAARDSRGHCPTEPCRKGHACDQDPCRIDLITRQPSPGGDDSCDALGGAYAPSSEVEILLRDPAISLNPSAPPDALWLGPPAPASNFTLPLLV